MLKPNGTNLHEVVIVKRHKHTKREMKALLVDKRVELVETYKVERNFGMGSYPMTKKLLLEIKQIKGEIASGRY